MIVYSFSILKLYRIFIFHFQSSIFGQKLKAALYYTTLKISNELAEAKEVTLSRQVVASIAETTWGQCQQFAEDLEMFAKYAS